MITFDILVDSIEGKRQDYRALRIKETWKPDYLRHIFISGGSGTGKSSLTWSIARSLIESGQGVGVLDLHNSWAWDLLNYIPKTRMRDVVFIDPTDTEFPIGHNIVPFSAPQAVEHTLDAFRSVWNITDDKTLWLLQHTLKLHSYQPDTTLLDVPRTFGSSKYRDKLLKRCKDTITRDFFRFEFSKWDMTPRFKIDMIAPIVSKVDQLLSNDALKLVFGQVRNGVDYRRLIDERRIVIFRLREALLGEHMALVAGLYLSAFRSAAVSRDNVPKEKRVPFTLIIEGVQKLTGARTIKGLLSEGSDLGLGLVLVQGGGSPNEDITRAAFGAAGTQITFRTSDRIISPEFLPVRTSELGEYRVAVKEGGEIRIGNTDAPDVPSLFNTLLHYAKRPKLVRLSQERFGTEAQEVIAEQNQFFNGGG